MGNDQAPMSLFNKKKWNWETTGTLSYPVDTNCLKVGHYLYALGTQKNNVLKKVAIKQLINGYDLEALNEYDQVRSEWKSKQSSHFIPILNYYENDEEYRNYLLAIFFVFSEVDDNNYMNIRHFINLY